VAQIEIEMIGAETGKAALKEYAVTLTGRSAPDLRVPTCTRTTIGCSASSSLRPSHRSAVTESTQQLGSVPWLLI